MGMTLDDVMRCTLCEFYEAYDAWQEKCTNDEHGEWERVRMLCLCILQPHSEKRLSPRDIMQFPWDEVPQESPAHDPTPEELLKSKARYEAEKKARGIS